uniref:DNA polymerase n=1 Tax=Ramaria rubella TaxID=113071 RepID=UPI002238C90C|nr:DNA polymerase [Ramaria rubella]UYR22230.1 DNA polymerase [Ramaria rubella]
MLMAYADKVQDTKIGSLDLETYGSEQDGLGKFTVYAGGCALSDGYKALYYNDKDKGLNSGEDIIHKMFEELFNYIAEDKKARNGHTLYAHNLGRFDSVFLLKSLASAGYDLKAKWRENDILSIRISDKGRKLNIKLMDSIKIVPTSLDKLLKSFDCKIIKGMFPHKFVNQNNLNYIGLPAPQLRSSAAPQWGTKPQIKYYLDDHKINEDTNAEYALIPDDINLKEKCLEYLDKDVLGLLEAMNKVNDHYYKEYNLNITKFSTLPSFSLAMFGYWFYNPVLNSKKFIKIIKGPLESFIRQAYFGGNSDIFVTGNDRFVSEGLHYDMNSQYPNAMKKRMATGQPVFSNNTDLNYYTLGFVFAKITAPTEDILPNLFIQKRNEDGSVSCPRESFYEYISTEDLRQGLEYGYKAEILCGVNFPDACEEGDLFGNFVDTLYDIKSSAIDNVQKSIAKLTLNSTYGKFGQALTGGL